MSGVVERILSAEVSAEDLDGALTAVNSLEPEDHDDVAARGTCLIELFGEQGRHEVRARVAAIDWRLQALARLSTRPQFRNWSLAGPDGNAIIAWTVLKAAATEPLIEIDGQPGFDADRFFERLVAMRKEDRHG